MLLFEPISVSSLLCPIAADSHAAPFARMTAGAIDKEERAGRSLASFHIGEVLVADEVRKRSRNGKEQRFGRLPTPLPSPGETGCFLPFLSAIAFSVADCDLTEFLVAREELVEGLQLP